MKSGGRRKKNHHYVCAPAVFNHREDGTYESLQLLLYNISERDLICASIEETELYTGDWVRGWKMREAPSRLVKGSMAIDAPYRIRFSVPCHKSLLVWM